VPVKGDPNVVGVPLIVGTPVWVYGHVGVLGAVDTDGVEGGVMPLSGGSKLITGAERFGFRATDGGLRPPPPISVEPSGMPTGPTGCTAETPEEQLGVIPLFRSGLGMRAVTVAH
jgi:hypothetical protein